MDDCAVGGFTLKEQKKRSQEIDAMLREEKKRQMNQCTLLMLGTKFFLFTLFSGNTSLLCASLKEALARTHGRNTCLSICTGPGQSGKSTFCKQMKILHLIGFTDEEKENFKYLIHTNIIQVH